MSEDKNLEWEDEIDLNPLEKLNDRLKELRKKLVEEKEKLEEKVEEKEGGS